MGMLYRGCLQLLSFSDAELHEHPLPCTPECSVAGLHAAAEHLHPLAAVKFKMLFSSDGCPLALQAGAGASVSPAASLVSPERGSQGLLGQSLQQMPPSDYGAPPAVAQQAADLVRLERTSISEGTSPSRTATLLWSQDQAAGGGVPAPAPAPRQQAALAAALLRSPSMAAFVTPPPCKLGSLQEFVTSEVRPAVQHHEVCMTLSRSCQGGHGAACRRLSSLR